MREQIRKTELNEIMLPWNYIFLFMCIISTNTWLKWILQKRVDSGKRAGVLFDHFALMVQILVLMGQF